MQAHLRLNSTTERTAGTKILKHIFWFNTIFAQVWYTVFTIKTLQVCVFELCTQQLSN